MTWIDGAGQHTPLELDCDVVIVGSGPAGSAVARVLAPAGLRVVIVEAGPRLGPADFHRSGFAAMSQSYRELGASVSLGRGFTPIIQGKMVGGSSPINGAICWRLPADVHAAWCAADPGLREALDWETLETLTDAAEGRLGVAPTDPSIAGRKNGLLALGAERLGLEHRPIRRNVVGCLGLGRCMQGCPEGRKNSVDRTLLADAIEAGGVLVSNGEVARVELQRGRATGVVGRCRGGARFVVRARRGVVLAASAVQSPSLLLASGLQQGPVGFGFQGHPGVSMAGRFPEPVHNWEGATQGHEVVGLRKEGLKFEALGMDLSILAARMPGVGSAFASRVADLAHHVEWGVAVRAGARGRVRRVFGKTVVSWAPNPNDVRQYRRGLRVLGEMMFAAGAERVFPGVRGMAPEITDPRALQSLEVAGPSDPAAFAAVITHMFGTCAMGTDPNRSVVRPDFRHHAVDCLYVADSSVFPTNIGVNPQIAIIALASLCGHTILGRRPPVGARHATWGSSPEVSP
jgi:choline dehydrogenase-like flavoprotein